MEDVELRTKGVTAITGFFDDDHRIYYIVFGMTVQVRGVREWREGMHGVQEMAERDAYVETLCHITTTIFGDNRDD